MTTKARQLSKLLAADSALAGGSVQASKIVGTIPITVGGTNATAAQQARTNLGLSIGSDVQAWHSVLDNLVALAGTSGFLKKSGSNTWQLDTSTYLTGNQTITFSGDASGSGATTVTLTLANSGVTAGTYGSATNIPQFAVDAKGRITSVSNVAVSIPSGSLTFTGDVTGTGNTGSSTALTLANSGVTAGTYTKVTIDAKGRATSGTTLSASDIPSLDASKITSGTIDAARLPSYVDDVLEYANLAGFPASGETGKIYVARDTNKAYRWSGSAYVYITSGAVDSVAGKTGVVTLTNADVGLGNVENKSSATIRGELTSANVTTALGFTPYNSTNPNGYTSNTGTVTSVSGTGTVSGLTLTGTVTGSGSLTLGGTLSLTSANVTAALGYTPLSNAGGTLTGTLTTAAPSNYWSTAVTGLTGAPLRIPFSSVGTTARFVPAVHQSVGYDSGYYTHVSTGIYKDANSWGAGYYIAIGGNDGYPTQWYQFRYDNLLSTSYGFLNVLGSVRSEIFYDSNNTNYYLDPASTSVLNDVRAYTGILVNNASGSGYGINLYSGNGYQPTYGIYFAQTANFGTYGGVTADWATYFTMNSTSGRGWIFREVESAGNIASISNAGLATFNNSVRSPIFYDSGNTGFYLDPASTSRLSSIDFGTSGYSIHMGDWGMRNTTPYGWIQFGPANTSHAHIYTDRSNFYFNAQLQVNGGSNVNTSDIRANLFYDNQDTGYYVDPNSSSRLVNLGLGGVTPDVRLSVSGDAHISTYLYLGGTAGSVGSWSARMISSGGATSIQTNTFEVNRTGYGGNAVLWTDTGENVYSNASHRAPIFYDRNDTGYYIDPNSTSVLNNTVVASAISNTHNGLRNIFPQGGSYVTGSSTLTGAIKITLPESSYPMLRFTVRVYTYDGLSFDIYCGGHTSGGTWYNTFAYMTTQHRSALNVRFTYGNSQLYVYIGELGSTWSYPQVFITDVQVGYTNYEYTRWDDNWAIGFETSTYNNISATHTVYPPPSSSNNVNPIYASFLYDANDTGYYIDPNSTSNSALRMRGGALFGPNTSWGAYLGIGTNGHAGSSYGSVAVTNGNLHIDAASGYDMYLNNYAGSNVYYSYAGTTRGGFYTDGSVRGHLFYDFNDTSYYIDPASTSVLNRISTVRTNNWLYIDNNYGHSVVGVYSSYRYQGVWSMGASYLLAADGTTTGNLYGIAWSHPNAGGAAANLASHGMLILENGGFQGAWGGGRLVTTSDIRSTILYDYNNTGYYLDPNSTSYLYHLVLSGGSYFRPNNWIQFDGSYGLYWPNNNGAHLHANDLSSYGQLAMRGSGNGWGGIYDQYSAVNGIMYDSSGNGGVYRQADSLWYFYYNRSHDCMGIGTSATSSTYSLYLNKGIFAQSRIDATIYYDYNNTAYYLDPTGTTSLRTYGDWRATDIAWTGEFAGKMQYHSNNWYIQFTSNVLFRNSGGTNVLTCDSSGNLTANGNVTAYSDARLKENIYTIEGALSKVLNLRGVYYNKIGETQRKIGLVAQEAQQIIPEVVISVETVDPATGTTSDLLAVDYGNTVALLIEAIKEQQQTIQQQAQRIEKLEKLLQQLI